MQKVFQEFFAQLTEMTEQTVEAGDPSGSYCEWRVGLQLWVTLVTLLTFSEPQVPLLKNEDNHTSLTELFVKINS